jgi:hypothetical protein
LNFGKLSSCIKINSDFLQSYSTTTENQKATCFFGI